MPWWLDQAVRGVVYVRMRRRKRCTSTQDERALVRYRACLMRGCTKSGMYRRRLARKPHCSTPTYTGAWSLFRQLTPSVLLLRRNVFLILLPLVNISLCVAHSDWLREAVSAVLFCVFCGNNRLVALLCLLLCATSTLSTTGDGFLEALSCAVPCMAAYHW